MSSSKSIIDLLNLNFHFVAVELLDIKLMILSGNGRVFDYGLVLIPGNIGKIMTSSLLASLPGNKEQVFT